MPELPEVETIRRQLEKGVKGKIIRDAEVFFAGRLNLPSVRFRRGVVGAKITGIDRRAKLLLIRLSNGRTLIVHLKMTGRFLLTPSGVAPTAHARVLFRLSGGRDLHFDDMRKFGFLKLLGDEEAAALLVKEGYGPEPLEKGFTAGVFADCLAGPGPRRIKPRMISQQCVAGIGNIYADEALWRARIRPDRRIERLSKSDMVALHRGVIDVLGASLKRHGTSADDYVDLYGRKGRNVPYLKVYDRAGEPCLRCRTPIKKIRYAGRGTHFCPKCQS